MNHCKEVEWISQINDTIGQRSCLGKIMIDIDTLFNIYEKFTIYSILTGEKEGGVL